MNRKLLAISALALATMAFANPASASNRAAALHEDTDPIPQPAMMIEGYVIWEARQGEALPLTLYLRQPQDPGIEAKYQTVTDQNGNFDVQVIGLPDGEYGWTVKGPQYLSRSGTVTLSYSEAAKIDTRLMLTGDVNNDNVVSISDVQLLRLSFGKQVGDAGYNAAADLTGDKVVNISDLHFLRKNFGLGGN